MTTVDNALVSLLETADAPRHLHWLSLAEAFFKFVLRDPGVVALADLVLEKEPQYADVLRKGQAPGPFVRTNWKWSPTPEELAYEFIYSPMIFLEDPPRKASQAVVRVAAVLADRLAALKRVIVSGEVTTNGTFSKTGVHMPISRMEWARKNLEIDVANGDLLDGEHYPPTVKWTGIMFEMPVLAIAQHPSTPADIAEPMLHVKPIEHVQIRSTAVLEPTSPGRAARRAKDSLEVATACEAWLFGIISASPSRPTHIRDELLELALEKFGAKLSKRQFWRCRDAAIFRANAPAWKQAGARKKSSH